MTKEQYFEFAEKFYKDALETSKRKNADYTGGSQDPFSNFTSVEILGIKTEIGFLTRMFDKMKRISSFVNNGELQVKDESVTDTLSDLANYACLMAGYLKSKRNDKNTNIKLPDKQFQSTKIPGDRSIYWGKSIPCQSSSSIQNGSRSDASY